MNDLESRLYDALHADGEHTPSGLSGPALRRTAHRRTLRVRTGGVAVVGAAAVAGVVVAPGLLNTSATRTGAGVGATATTTGPVKAAGRVVAKDPASKAQPKASFTGKPAPAAVASATASSVPVQAYLWSPAGSLINNATVLATAPKVAATDTDWQSWGGTLLEKDTVSVVFAERAAIRSSGPDDARPLIVVTGRTSAAAPLQIAVLTSVAGGVDAENLSALTVAAMYPAQTPGPQAIAVSNGLSLYVAANGGVDSATYTYTDDSGSHTAAMKVANGVAVAANPMADLKASAIGKITNVKAISHGKVVWDAAPVEGR